MTPFPVPSRLAAHSHGRGPWLAALPGVVAGLAARWSLTVGPPFEPGGRTSWVAPAGADRVLKVGFPGHHEARDEGAGLRVWAGRGAVRVFAEHADDVATALLLERAVPGRPLSARPGPEQDEVLTGLLRELWAAPHAGNPFRPLTALCDAWADGAAAGPGSDRLDPGLRRTGFALFRALPRDDVAPVLLATDLHAGNVLTARRAPWLVIDPKPYVGDPCYDVLQHLLNGPARLTADPRGFVARVADLAGCDRDRVARWLVARCVVEAGWWPHAAAVAAALRV